MQKNKKEHVETAVQRNMIIAVLIAKNRKHRGFDYQTICLPTAAPPVPGRSQYLLGVIQNDVSHHEFVLANKKPLKRTMKTASEFLLDLANMCKSRVYVPKMHKNALKNACILSQDSGFKKLKSGQAIAMGFKNLLTWNQ